MVYSDALGVANRHMANGGWSGTIYEFRVSRLSMGC
ncbi:Uncharacterised protein [Mycobacteroides abscessus]|nr:Uncharacterised protein [Mycobacteroides abscessus]